VHWWVGRARSRGRRIRPPVRVRSIDFVFSSVLKESEPSAVRPGTIPFERRVRAARPLRGRRSTSSSTGTSPAARRPLRTAEQARASHMGASPPCTSEGSDRPVDTSATWRPKRFLRGFAARGRSAPCGSSRRRSGFTPHAPCRGCAGVKPPCGVQDPSYKEPTVDALAPRTDEGRE
jgi:hypothetical protein